jgi:hypothetical protein
VGGREEYLEWLAVNRNGYDLPLFNNGDSKESDVERAVFEKLYLLSRKRMTKFQFDLRMLFPKLRDQRGNDVGSRSRNETNA